MFCLKESCLNRIVGNGTELHDDDYYNVQHIYQCFCLPKSELNKQNPKGITNPNQPWRTIWKICLVFIAIHIKKKKQRWFGSRRCLFDVEGLKILPPLKKTTLQQIILDWEEGTWANEERFKYNTIIRFHPRL